MFKNMDVSERKKLLKEELFEEEFKNLYLAEQKCKANEITLDKYKQYYTRYLKLAWERRLQRGNNPMYNSMNYNYQPMQQGMHQGMQQSTVQQNMPQNLQQNFQVMQQGLKQPMQQNMQNIQMNNNQSMQQQRNQPGAMLQTIQVGNQNLQPNMQVRNGMSVNPMQQMRNNSMGVISQSSLGQGVRIFQVNQVGNTPRNQNYALQGSFPIHGGINDSLRLSGQPHQASGSRRSTSSPIDRSQYQRDDQSKSGTDPLKQQLKTERDPQKIKPKFLKNALTEMKRYPERRREFLENHPWLSVYLKRQKARKLKEGYQPRWSHLEFSKTMGIGRAGDISLLAKAQLQNKLNLLAESRGYSGCTPQIISKVTEIVTQKVTSLLKELRNVAMYKGDENLAKYETRHYYRSDANEHQSYLPYLIRNENSDIEPNQLKPRLSHKLQNEGEGFALSFLENVTSKRKQIDQSSNEVDVSQFQDRIARNNTGKRVPDSTNEPRTITPTDFQTVFDKDTFFRQSRTLDSLLHFHLQ